MQRGMHWPYCIDMHCPGCMPDLQVVGPQAYNASAGESILVAHSRIGIGACLCGWSELGRSFAEHQVQKLVEAGLIKDKVE